MRGLAELIGERGVDLAPLMARAGIPADALQDDDLRISLLAYAQLLEEASVAAGCPDLGLCVAERQDIGILGPLAIAMQNAATVGEALQVCSRYLHVHSPGIRLSVHPDLPRAGLAAVRITVVTPAWVPRRQLVDQCLADLFHFSAWLAQDRPPVLSVALPHLPLAPAARYARFYGTDVDFAQPHSEIVVPVHFFGQSLRGASAALHRLSLDYLQLAFEPGRLTVGERVEAVLRRALSSTRGRREIVAKLLGMHPRTLQRRLAEEGCTYQQLLDAVRRERAYHWLATTEVPLIQVAGLLGLADQTVLNRNCRRWFGRTPGDMRLSGSV